MYFCAYDRETGKWNLMLISPRGFMPKVVKAFDTEEEVNNFLKLLKE